MIDVPSYDKNTNLGTDGVSVSSVVKDYPYTDSIDFETSFDPVAIRNVSSSDAHTGEEVFGRIESGINEGDSTGFYRIITSDGTVLEVTSSVGAHEVSLIRLGVLYQVFGGATTIGQFDGDFNPFTTQVYDLGSATQEWVDIYLVNAPTVSSDKRFKKNIVPSEYGLQEVRRMKPVLFEREDAIRHIGLIAQDMKDVVPEVVKGNGKVGYSIAYEELIPILARAIQELDSRITRVEKILMV